MCAQPARHNASPSKRASSPPRLDVALTSLGVDTAAGPEQRGTLMSARPRVLVADDHRAMLDTLVRMLSRDFDVVAAVSDGLSAVAEAEHLEPDLLVLDIAMPGLNGIAAAARLKERGSTAKVVFVTNMRDREFVQESLALGDVGFVVKDRLVADLLPAIRRVLAGETFVSPSVSR
jgi:DNA-binding NarL/FixJ family response regulator